MARGYNAFGDFAAQTADGRDLSDLYSEFQAALDATNEDQNRFVDLLTYKTDAPVVSVLQSLGTDHAFEEASEYGVPQARRISPSTLDMGASFKWYDNRTGWTWRYLADAKASDLQAQTNAVLAADQDLLFEKVMHQLYRSDNTTVVDPRTKQSHTVFTFWNGDGIVPPSYAGNTFDGNHTHYRTSGAATVDSGDLDEIIDDFKSHGYSEENGSQIVVFVNKEEADVINGFRVADGDREDFVPASGARFFSPDHLIGSQPSSTWGGFPVRGSYGEALIIESSRIPAGYVTALSSGGSNLSSNPLMLREHKKFKGLQLIPGDNRSYPLKDAYFTHGFGLGVRHRGAGIVLQVTTDSTYSAPSLYVA